MKKAEKKNAVAEKIGNRISQIRKEKKLTQEALSEKVSETMNANTISGIEQGKGNPKISTIYAIARGLEVSLAELVDEENPKTGLRKIEAEQEEIVYGLLKRMNEKERAQAIRLLKAIQE